MLVSHIRFMAQVNKEAAKAKKNEIMNAMRSLKQMPQRFPFFNEPYITPNKYPLKCLFKNGILFFTKSKTIQFILTIS